MARSPNRRTVFLGALATIVFVWAAIDRFGVPPEEMAWLMVYCVLGVFTTMVLAALTVGLVLLVKLLAARLKSPGATAGEPPPE